MKVHRSFGPFDYKRVGEVVLLTVFGLPLYRRIGSVRAIGRLVLP